MFGPARFLGVERVRSGTFRLSAVVFFAAISSGEAHASPPAQSMRPAAAAENYVATESSQVLPSLAPSATLLTGYGRSTATHGADKWSIDQRASAHLLVAFGLFNHAQLDIDLPMVVHQSGDNIDDQATLTPAAFGDLRTTLKGTILHTHSRGFGLGTALDLYWPTGDADALATFGGTSVGINVLAEYRAIRGIRAALNLGYLVRPDEIEVDYSFGDAFTYRLAGRVPFGPHFQFSGLAELDGAVSIVDGGESPLLARAGLDWSMRSGISLGVFVGGSLISSLGQPGVEGLLRVGYAPPTMLGRERSFVGARRPGARELARNYDSMVRPTQALVQAPARPDDPDNDGLLAFSDRCPNVAEDRDEFEDQDGCPEYDNDRDGIADRLDLCPNAPELTNGFADWDGCPDRRLADGGESWDHFDPQKIYPQIEWIGTSGRLTTPSQQAVAEFAELLRLNPWLGPFEIEIDGPALAKGTTIDPLHPGSTRAEQIATEREMTLRDAFAKLGVEPWRVHFAQTRPAPPSQPAAVRFALQGQNSGLRPLAPSTATIEAMVAQAAEQIRQNEARERALQTDPNQHRGQNSPVHDPSLVDVMTQGPDATSPANSTTSSTSTTRPTPKTSHPKRRRPRKQPPR